MNSVSLDQIAGSDEAVFAIDRTDRIIVWNKACENLLGHRAADVRGKFCFDVMAGRDIHGNIHCYENCPVVHQLRRVPGEPIRRFAMRARAASGEWKRVSASAFLLDGENPRLGVIAHVLKNEGEDFSRLEHRLHRLAATSATRPGVAIKPTAEELTGREREILCCLARGMSTEFIANHLWIARVTVRNHVRNILQKLGVHTRFAAVAYAYQNDIV